MTCMSRKATASRLCSSLCNRKEFKRVFDTIPTFLYFNNRFPSFAALFPLHTRLPYLIVRLPEKQHLINSIPLSIQWGCVLIFCVKNSETTVRQAPMIKGNCQFSNHKLPPNLCLHPAFFKSSLYTFSCRGAGTPSVFPVATM